MLAADAQRQPPIAAAQAQAEQARLVGEGERARRAALAEANAIEGATLTQRFFPAGVEVELSFIPEDELPALIEESLLMPPLDLTAGLEALDGVGVIVLVPLTRAEFITRRSSLPNWDADQPRLRLPVRDLRARATPRELLLANVFLPTRPSAPPRTPWPAQSSVIQAVMTSFGSSCRPRSLARKS